MTTKQELYEQANKLQEQAKQLQEELDELNEKLNNMLEDDLAKRWRADSQTIYWFIDIDGDYYSSIDNNKVNDRFLYDIGNYFKTEQKAKEYKENLITKQKLKDLALKLNKEFKATQKVNSSTKHYYITYDTKHAQFYLNYHTQRQTCDIHCYSKDFLNKAIEVIGEHKLKCLLTFERE